MKIIDLTKRFDDKTVFDNYSLELNDGAVTYIMGSSGIGKTTLLRIISGLDKEFSGTVEYNGSLAYVFQEPRLFPTLNVLQNIAVVNDNSKFDPRELLKLVELEDTESMMPNELSGGMKMRLSIARAIYSDADIILMDEPFASLDEDMKERIAPKIFELLKGKTIIVISHQLNDAEKYADNIVKIEKTD